MPNPRLVVTDDDAAYLDMIVSVLNDAGFDDVYCVVGSRSFSAIQERQPDLVLLDINPITPDNGWNTLHLMRLNATTTHIPVLICTTDTRIMRDKVDMLRAQGCDILEKPFNLEVFLAKINAMLGVHERTVNE